MESSRVLRHAGLGGIRHLHRIRLGRCLIERKRCGETAAGAGCCALGICRQRSDCPCDRCFPLARVGSHRADLRAVPKTSVVALGGVEGAVAGVHGKRSDSVGDLRLPSLRYEVALRVLHGVVQSRVQSPCGFLAIEHDGIGERRVLLQDVVDLPRRGSYRRLCPRREARVDEPHCLGHLRLKLGAEVSVLVNGRIGCRHAGLAHQLDKPLHAAVGVVHHLLNERRVLDAHVPDLVDEHLVAVAGALVERLQVRLPVLGRLDVVLQVLDGLVQGHLCVLFDLLEAVDDVVRPGVDGLYEVVHLLVVDAQTGCQLLRRHSGLVERVGDHRRVRDDFLDLSRQLGDGVDRLHLLCRHLRYGLRRAVDLFDVVGHAALRLGERRPLRLLGLLQGVVLRVEVVQLHLGRDVPGYVALHRVDELRVVGKPVLDLLALSLDLLKLHVGLDHALQHLLVHLLARLLLGSLLPCGRHPGQLRAGLVDLAVYGVYHLDGLSGDLVVAPHGADELRLHVLVLDLAVAKPVDDLDVMVEHRLACAVLLPCSGDLLRCLGVGLRARLHALGHFGDRLARLLRLDVGLLVATGHVSHYSGQGLRDLAAGICPLVELPYRVGDCEHS